MNCKHCGEAFFRRSNETNARYRERSYCGQSCSRSALNIKLREENKGALLNKGTERKAKLLGEKELVPSYAKINPDIVRSIREMNRVLGFSAREISEYRKIPITTVKNVLAGLSWRHVV